MSLETNDEPISNWRVASDDTTEGSNGSSQLDAPSDTSSFHNWRKHWSDDIEPDNEAEIPYAITAREVAIQNLENMNTIRTMRDGRQAVRLRAELEATKEQVEKLHEIVKELKLQLEEVKTETKKKFEKQDGKILFCVKSPVPVPFSSDAKDFVKTGFEAVTTGDFSTLKAKGSALLEAVLL